MDPTTRKADSPFTDDSFKATEGAGNNNTAMNAMHIDPATGTAIAKPKGVAAKAPAPPGGARVLLAEDHHINMKVWAVTCQRYMN